MARHPDASRWRLVFLVTAALLLLPDGGAVAATAALLSLRSRDFP